MTRRLALWTSRRPRRTIAAWALALVVAIALIGALLEGALTTEDHLTNEPESERADALKTARFLPETAEASEVVVVRSDRLRVDDPAFRRRVRGLADELRGAGAAGVTSFYDRRDERLVSAGRDATLLSVVLGPDPEERIDAVVAAVESADGERGFEVVITGKWTLDADISTLADDDLRTGELSFGLPAALIILLIVFGAVVAALVPLLLALSSIVVALALAALIGQGLELGEFAVNMIAGMGLALGVDYSLFVLSRYREERAGGRDRSAAIAGAGATASRAVLFSGGAFTLAMLGLMLVPDTLIRSLAAGAILVAIVSVLAALTLLPAVLGLVGDRVNALRIPGFSGSRRGESGRFWSAIVAGVMRRPVLSLAVASIALLAAATPVLALTTGEAGISTIPDRFPSKQGFVALNAEFPGETADPVEVVVDGPIDSAAVRDAIGRLQAIVGGEDAFGAPALAVNPARDLAILTVPVAGDAHGSDAIDAVRELRREHAPAAFAGSGAEVLVGGTTAEEIDEIDTFGRWLPIVLAFVLSLSFALLTVAFRSIVVAAKAIVMNLLSVGAAYGVLVLVFQRGVGNELFGFERIDTVEYWIPLFLFAVLFGLSMDYEVFLLSRISERFARTGDNRDAVAHGVHSTARIITGAALIIVAVFAGFARGDLVMFQQMGFGVAVALLIDATIVRLVLVPAAMLLLGEWNWYLPRWLRWLPDLRIEGARPAAEANPSVPRPAGARPGGDRH